MAPASSGETAPRENPPRECAHAALFTATRVSAVTGTRPSSSKTPIAFVRNSSWLGSLSATGGLAGSSGSCPLERSKQQRNVANRARHRTDRTQNRKRPHARRQMPSPRNPSRRRLQRTDSRKVRRHSYRSATVAAQSRRGHPRRNRRRLAPARPARRALQIPGISRAPMKQSSRSHKPSETPGSWSCPESTLLQRAAAPPRPHPLSESRPCAAGCRSRTDSPQSQSMTLSSPANRAARRAVLASASSCCACARTRSASKSANALICGFSRSICRMCASASSSRKPVPCAPARAVVVAGASTIRSWLSSGPQIAALQSPTASTAKTDI